MSDIQRFYCINIFSNLVFFFDTIVIEAIHVWNSTKQVKIFDFFLEYEMGLAKLCHHPPPSTTTHHHPPPPTTSQIYPPPPTTAHYQPNISPLPTSTPHHPSPPTTSQNISTATYHFPKNGPPRYKSQNIFIYNLLLTLL